MYLGEWGLCFDHFQEDHDDDDDITEPEQGSQLPWRSTKQPLSKDRKFKAKQQKSKEDIMLDEAMSVLNAKKNRVMDAD